MKTSIQRPILKTNRMSATRSITLTILFILVNIFSVSAQIPDDPKDIAPLLIGEQLPDATLLNAKGETINLNDKIKTANTVLVFYRGGWCPYCNRQLSGLVAAEAKIIELGYQIIAVSPDDYRNISPTTTKNKANYQLYSDPNGTLIQEMGVGFTTAPKTFNYISKKTIGETTKVLPVPTVLVLNKKGEILFEYISPNYKQRISPKLLLAVLENLK